MNDAPRTARISGQDVRTISVLQHRWHIVLRCEQTVIVPFAVLDGTDGVVWFDLDGAVLPTVCNGQVPCPCGPEFSVCVIRSVHVEARRTRPS